MIFQTIIQILCTKIIPLGLAFIGFGLLIIVHELGHFLFSKLFGILTPTFSIGFGPTILQKKIGTTLFRLAAIPLGGYVEIAGLAEIGQGEQRYAYDISKNSFSSKPYWQKFLVLIGGILCNMLFAYTILTCLYTIGMPAQKANVTIHSTTPNSPAHLAGLLPGDIVLSVNDQSFNTDPEKTINDMQTILLPMISQNANKTIYLKIKRNNEEMTLPTLLGAKETDGKTEGVLGAAFTLSLELLEGKYKKLPFIKALYKGISHTNHYVKQIFLFLKSMIGKRSLKGAGGPIAILSTSFEMAQQGIRLLLIFLAIISINLAVFNILPLGVVDGGQLVMVTIESIIRRPIPENIKIGINLIFWLLILALFLFLSYRDILFLLGR